MTLSLCMDVGGILLARLIASRRDIGMAAWLGVAAYSSLDVESWRELPPCSGETTSNCMSMS